MRIKQTPREDGYYRKKSCNVEVTEEFCLDTQETLDVIPFAKLIGAMRHDSDSYN